MKTFKEDEIRVILEKYFEAETNSLEEKMLQDYFNESECLPDDLKSYAPLFVYRAEAAAAIESPIALDSPLAIDNSLALDATTRNEAPAKHPSRMKLILNLSISVAAAACLATILFLEPDIVWNKQANEEFSYYVNGEKINDGEMAIAYTQDQLDKLHETMSRALKKPKSLEKAGEQFNKMNTRFSRIAAANLENLSK